MTIISLIAAVDEQYGLGKDNGLLCHLPADLQYFKAQTSNKPVIMGRKTWESIGRPLPNRINIVISRNPLEKEGIVHVDSLTKALNMNNGQDEMMIIGGAEIFAQSLPFAHRIYLTRIHHAFDADVFFPQTDWKVWKEISHTFRPKDEKNPFDMTFYIYERH